MKTHAFCKAQEISERRVTHFMPHAVLNMFQFAGQLKRRVQDFQTYCTVSLYFELQPGYLSCPHVRHP